MYLTRTCMDYNNKREKTRLHLSRRQQDCQKPWPDPLPISSSDFHTMAESAPLTLGLLDHLRCESQ